MEVGQRPGRSLLSEALLRLGADDALLAPLREADEDDGPEALAASLVAAADGEEKRSALADLAGTVARRLAPEDEPPTQADAAFAWFVLLCVADGLYGSAVANLGRLPFISDRLLALMAEEARVQLGSCSDATARTTAAGGRALNSLAVSRKLQEAIGSGLGVPVAPGYRALYAYDPPGSHVATHLDSREYELIFHMILEHDPPADGSPDSALVAHLPGQGTPVHVSLRPGEGVALSGRGTLHSWQRLGAGERRTMVEIAWVRA
ncbi:MAG TPA: hypothetical protein VIH85_22665 [Solirubrobacteraceae bacterium]